jgi:hypothetical protein
VSTAAFTFTVGHWDIVLIDIMTNVIGGRLAEESKRIQVHTVRQHSLAEI